MRWLLASVAFVLLAAGLPSATAQTPLLTMAEDGGGDVKITLGDQTQAAPAGRYDQADLLKTEAVETTDGFTFTIQVKTLVPNPDIPFVDNMQYYLEFRNKDRDFRLHAFRTNFVTPIIRAQLEARDGAHGPYYVALFDLPTRADASTNTISMDVPRDALLDGSGSVPHPGQPFTGFHAMARGALLDNQNINVGGAGTTKSPGPFITDRMPDTGNGTGFLDIKQGVAQLGLARLYSEVPTRSSNGENTTFVYTVLATNLGKNADRYDLTTDKVPAGWTVRLPASTVDIEGNQTISFPVLVSTPFQHIHGEYLAFTVNLASQTDASSVGRIQLGIRYPAIPQPAQHHDKLYLYAQGLGTSEVETNGLCAVVQGGSGCSIMYMNAAESDPASDPSLSVPAFSCGFSPPVTRFCWPIQLSPGLELGLDFVTTAVGSFEVTLQQQIPMIGATLSGGLYYRGPQIFVDDGRPGGGNVFPNSDQDILLATIDTTAPKDVLSSSPQLFSTTVTPTIDSDYIPYAKDSGLYLMLYLEGTTPSIGTGPDPHPAIVPGGFLQLPLLEYHDAVNLTFASTDTLELAVGGAQDRLANPNTAVLFNVTLLNHGATGKFRAEVSGNNHQWAEVLAPQSLNIGAGGSLTIPVAVRVPSNAQAGQVADLVLTVSNLANLNERAITRLYVTVDLQGQHPDDSAAVNALAEAGKPKKSPGAESALLLVGLAALVLVARRRVSLK